MVARPWKVHGPYDLDKNDERSWPRLLTAVVAATNQHILDAPGVYVIGVKNPVRTQIRYIGMTKDQGFGREVCSQTNVGKVWDVINNAKSTTMRVWLLAKEHVTREGYCNSEPIRAEAHHLEEMLIMLANAAGHDLLNDRKQLSASGKAVAGLFGAKRAAGRPPSAAKTLADALKL
jgi:hypothetical protein